MTVKRIISNIAVSSLGAVRELYSDRLGLSVVMGHGWIVILASCETAPVQVDIAIECSLSTEVPKLSIEVYDGFRPI